MGKRDERYAICSEIDITHLFETIEIIPCDHVDHRKPPSNYCPECGVKIGICKETVIINNFDNYGRELTIINPKTDTVYNVFIHCPNGVNCPYFLIYRDQYAMNYNECNLEVESQDISKYTEFTEECGINLTYPEMRLIYDGWNCV